MKRTISLLFLSVAAAAFCTSMYGLWAPKMGVPSHRRTPFTHEFTETYTDPKDAHTKVVTTERFVRQDGAVAYYRPTGKSDPPPMHSIFIPLVNSGVEESYDTLTHNVITMHLSPRLEEHYLHPSYPTGTVANCVSYVAQYEAHPNETVQGCLPSERMFGLDVMHAQVVDPDKCVTHMWLAPAVGWEALKATKECPGEAATRYVRSTTLLTVGPPEEGLFHVAKDAKVVTMRELVSSSMKIRNRDCETCEREKFNETSFNTVPPVY